MATLRITLQSGVQVEAPIEEWMAAILGSFPDSERARVAARLEMNRARGAAWTAAGKAIATPTRGYVLECEPGVIGLSRR